MRKFFEILVKTIIVIALFLSLWMFFLNFYNISADGYWVILTAFVITFITLIISKYCPYNRITNYFRNHSNFFYLLIVVITALSITARFIFCLFAYYPQSDPNNFFVNSINIAKNNQLLYHEYVATFPYLFAYDALLGMVMKIFGTQVSAVILLNTLLDVFSAFLLYKLILNIGKKKELAFIGAFLWLINPFNILFSVLSLPIVAVNTLIIGSLLITKIVLSNIKNTKKLILYSIIAGIIFSVSNSFRPIMTVFILAIFIYCLVFLIKKFNILILRNIGLSLSIIIFLFLTLTTAYGHIVSLFTGYPFTKNVQGWSVYVGTNYKTSGIYNTPDEKEFVSVLKCAPTISEAHAIIQKKGLERVSSYTPGEIADLLIKKSIVLFGDQQHSIYDLVSYPNFWSYEEIKLSLWSICAVYSYLLILLTVIFFYKYFLKNETKLSFIHFLTLVFIGLLLVSLLLEASGRYFMPFFVFLTIFSSFAIYNSRK